MNRPTSAAAIADDLYELTRYAHEQGYDTAHGALGGDWGYGADVDNDVFEMHPFWWGDCECGYDEREIAYEQSHPHTEDCYQAELDRRGYLSPDGYESSLPNKLAAEWSLPDLGCAVHCTCGRDDAARARQDDHDTACPIVRPNFRHKPSGFEVRWYKYIGRGMEFSDDKPSGKRWATIYDECVAFDQRRRGVNDNPARVYAYLCDRHSHRGNGQRMHGTSANALLLWCLAGSEPPPDIHPCDAADLDACRRTVDLAYEHGLELAADMARVCDRWAEELERAA